jgi:hypothetical protein
VEFLQPQVFGVLLTVEQRHLQPQAELAAVFSSL